MYSDIPVTVSDVESIPVVTSTTSTTAVEEPIEHNTLETSRTPNDPLLIGNCYPRHDRRPRQFTEPVVSH